MVAGHLQEKKGYFYIVLNYKDTEGHRKSKWISTGLKVKNNKRRAEALLQEVKSNFISEIKYNQENILFTEFLANWLEMIKPNVEKTTFSSYQSAVNGRIMPFFKKQKLKLTEVCPEHIQEYYTYIMRKFGITASTIKHHHANIRKALQYAVMKDLIKYNPADKVELPKIKKFVGSFYSVDEVKQLFEAVKGTKIELAVHFAAFYGMRRGEICGLKWENIDFNNNCFTVSNTINEVYIDGKTVIVQKNSPKNKASNRTYPLCPQHHEMLKSLKKQQQFNKKLCGKSYCKDFLDYVYVNELGVLIKTNYIAQHFPIVLQKHKLRKIRFHDLRHSCASLLLANGISIKEIQDWLGHGDYSTTANIYAHLDFEKKIAAARTMSRILGITKPPSSTDKGGFVEEKPSI